MATSERRTATRRAAPEETRAASVKGETEAHAEKIRNDLDDLTDEIDEALEENAEEFVNNYVQQGGQ